jgi:hypothetical protein
MSLSLLGWNLANMSFMIICIWSPPRLPIMQEQKSVTHHWLSSSAWGRECVSLVCSYIGSRLIQKGQWRTKVNILQLAVRYLIATVNGETRHTETELWPYRSSRNSASRWVDQCRSAIEPPRCSSPGFWIVLTPNETIFGVQTRTAAGLSEPIANTTHGHGVNNCNLGMCRKVTQMELGESRLLTQLFQWNIQKQFPIDCRCMCVYLAWGWWWC